MLARSIVIAATLTAAALTAPGAFAEPPKSQAQPAHSPASRPIVLASADAVKAPAATPVAEPQAPAKPRVARVTTCRCGDPLPQSDDDQE